jgi:hypothetical protein
MWTERHIVVVKYFAMCLCLYKDVLPPYKDTVQKFEKNITRNETAQFHFCK